MGAQAWLGRAVLGAVLLLASCRLNLPEDGRYRCASDADCGGQGFICHAPGTGLAFCCLPGTEGCAAAAADGGSASDAGGCLGADLMTDARNCGACGQLCLLGERCAQGVCAPAGEQNCATGADEDGDGLVDCADPDCDAQSCGKGCGCKGGARSEVDCRDGVDNDDNGKKDCDDPACAAVTCGAGCVCNGGGKSETSCTDGLDNDGDGRTDCADAEDCLDGAFCRAAPTSAVCLSGGCACDGGVAPATESACRDGWDNDCNGLTDCADLNCNGAPCNADGGFGCVCGAGARKETTCSQSSGDEDGDGLANCADPDCLNVSCGGGKKCAAGGTCS